MITDDDLTKHVSETLSRLKKLIDGQHVSNEMSGFFRMTHNAMVNSMSKIVDANGALKVSAEDKVKMLDALETIDKLYFEYVAN